MTLKSDAEFEEKLKKNCKVYNVLLRKCRGFIFHDT